MGGPLCWSQAAGIVTMAAAMDGPRGVETASFHEVSRNPPTPVKRR